MTVASFTQCTLLHHDTTVVGQGDRLRHLHLGPRSVVGGGDFQGLEVRVRRLRWDIGSKVQHTSVEVLECVSDHHHKQ